MEAKKFSKLFLNRNNADESGYALVMVLGIVILTIGILSSMTVLTIKDVKNSTKNRGVLESRIAGESALDSIYAAANAKGDPDLVTALTTFNIAGSPLGTLTNGGPQATGTNQTSTYYGWSTFFGIDSDGNIVTCPTAAANTKPCFKVRIIKVITKPTAGISALGGINVDDITATRVEYVADIVTRTRCDKGTTVNCSYSRIQQNLSLRKYIEYVSISAKEKVSPTVSATANVADPNALNLNYSYTNYYSGTDVVNGNIHTNDDVIRACDGFKSTWITSNGISGDSTKGVFDDSNFGCKTGPTTGVKKATRAPLALPERNADSTGLGLKNIANSDGSQYVTSGTIEFKGNGLSAPGTIIINGTSKPMPPSGVLYLTDNSTIFGEVDGKITVVSADGRDITISKNLTYEHGGVATNTQDMLGVYSGRDIKIACNNSTTTGRCSDIIIHGFLKAKTTEVAGGTPTSPPLVLGGTIYNPNWAGTVAGSTPPKLTLFGAMESYYRGTFGSIDSQSDQVKTGFQKDFTFDKRLTYQQPPFMLRDGTVPFIRNAVKDVPCGNFCNN